MGIRVDHHPRLNTSSRPIVIKYREGKVKRTPGGESKEPETACLQTVRRSWRKPAGSRAFCRMNRRLTLRGEVKRVERGAAAKASLNRANESRDVDPKPGDLSMSRVKHE